MIFRTATVALLLSQLGFASPIGNKFSQRESTLKWAPCDLDFPPTHQEVVDAHGVPVYCTTLKVPLDYSNPKNGRTLDLQLVKVEASKEPFKGSVIMNPGGPGASGVEEISKFGPMYRDVFGGNFNVIGFDARGTGRTLPFVCDPVSNSTVSLARRSTNFTVPQNDMYSVLESKAWHDADLYVNACAETEGFADIAHLLGTPFVARDMLNIVDALGEDGLLRFWGRSYSTVLGQTFAAMFPDRVGRILLDSVVLFDDYFSGQWALANRDTEVALLNYFRECINAGPEICSLANYTGPATTPQSLHIELANVLQELLDDPIILPDSYQPLNQPWWQPGTTMYQDLKYFILVYLYRPDQFPILDLLIGTAFKRDWQSLLQPAPSNSTGNATTTPEIPWNLGLSGGAFHGIGCSDGEFRADKPEDMYSLTRAQGAQGSWADVFAPQIWVCAQWPIKAAERFQGPFTGINTSHPILLVNSAQDPITPLSGAFEASVGLERSRVLVHNGHGHGVMNHPSNCTIKAIHDYFNDGTLPEIGTICEPNKSAYEVALEAVTEAPGGDGVQKRSLNNVGRRKLAIEMAKQKLQNREFETGLSF